MGNMKSMKGIIYVNFENELANLQQLMSFVMELTQLIGCQRRKSKEVVWLQGLVSKLDVKWKPINLLYHECWVFETLLDTLQKKEAHVYQMHLLWFQRRKQDANVGKDNIARHGSAGPV